MNAWKQASLSVLTWWLVMPAAAAPADFSGTWSFGSLTPLARPESMGDKSHFTPEEAAAFEDDFDEYIRKIFAEEAGEDYVGGDMWLDFGSYVEPDLRTSRIIDPENGRFPEPTEAGKALRAAAESARKTFAGPEVLSVTERCIFSGVPYLRAPDNNILTVVQTEDHLLMKREFAYGYRIIPLKDGALPPDDLRFWRGASSSRWEEDTLVVETRNMHPDYGIGPTGPDFELIEKFRLSPEGFLQYDLTVIDADHMTAPWTMRTFMRPTPHKNYEYACHEGNYRNMRGILAGERLLEREAAAQMGDD